ncbi:MAG: hypothetical protein U1E78_10855 [Gammaproteobacteria bacterium]
MSVSGPNDSANSNVFGKVIVDNLKKLQIPKDLQENAEDQTIETRVAISMIEWAMQELYKECYAIIGSESDAGVLMPFTVQYLKFNNIRLTEGDLQCINKIYSDDKKCMGEKAYTVTNFYMAASELIQEGRDNVQDVSKIKEDDIEKDRKYVELIRKYNKKLSTKKIDVLKVENDFRTQYQQQQEQQEQTIGMLKQVLAKIQVHIDDLGSQSKQRSNFLSSWIKHKRERENKRASLANAAQEVLIRFKAEIEETIKEINEPDSTANSMRAACQSLAYKAHAYEATKALQNAPSRDMNIVKQFFKWFHQKINPTIAKLRATTELQQQAKNIEAFGNQLNIPIHIIGNVVKLVESKKECLSKKDEQEGDDFTLTPKVSYDDQILDIDAKLEDIKKDYPGIKSVITSLESKENTTDSEDSIKERMSPNI